MNPTQSSSSASMGTSSEDNNRETTVVDVYDIASDIGKECEKIIDQFGADAVTLLMPKVINALELLETLATRNERENTQLMDLKTKIVQLENEKMEKAEYRQKFEKELEAIEEQWRSETKDLLALVSRLQDENRRLAKDASPKHSRNSPPTYDSVHGDGEILQHLKSSIDKQRDELRAKEKMLQEKIVDVENLKTQVVRLNCASRELRRKHKSFQGQVRTLCDERADFLVQMQDQQRDIMALRQRLGLAQKENEDLSKCEPLLPSNKAIYDLDDPNRPRFTTEELKDILHERNELKAKVSDLEDELDNYRPKKETKKSQLEQLIESACDNLFSGPKVSLAEPQEEDAPVQGPLPYEPDDAPWKKCSESGIRKFFRKLFSESGSGSGGSSFPRRSLSTLSKMALSSTSEPLPV